MQISRTFLFAALSMAALISRADAQAGPYKLQDINYDMWCQEERRLPPDRCDKRLPQDDAEYRAYVSKIENYEVQYLQKKNDEENFDRVILHPDPTNHQVEQPAPAPQAPPQD